MIQHATRPRRLPSPSFRSDGASEELTRRRRWCCWAGDEPLAFENQVYRVDLSESLAEIPQNGEFVNFWTARARSRDLPGPSGVCFAPHPANRIGVTFHVAVERTLRVLRHLPTYVEHDPYRRFYALAWWRLPFEPTDLTIALPVDHPLMRLDTTPQVYCFGLPWPVTGLAIGRHRSLAVLEGIE